MVVGLVVALVLPLLFSDEWVEAQQVEVTDTTAVSNNESDPDDSTETRGHCPYGHRADGTCRACPQRTFWANNGRCRPVSENTTDCDRNEAIVSSWPHCVWILCPPDYDNEAQLEYRDLTDGDCTDEDNSEVCPESDEEFFPRYARAFWNSSEGRYDVLGCRPSSCRYGRTSTGYCEDPPPPPPTTTTTTPSTVSYNPWFEDAHCDTYSANEEETWYLNMEPTPDIVKHPDTGVMLNPITDEALIRSNMSGHYGNCGSSGIMAAGMYQRGLDTPKGAKETYQIRWGFDEGLFMTYGLVPIKPGEEVDGTKDGPSDGCSGGRAEVKKDTYNRKVPCGAHDYCTDLVRFSASPKVTKSGDHETDLFAMNDCDTVFLDLMLADCQAQKKSAKCVESANRWMP